MKKTCALFLSFFFLLLGISAAPKADDTLDEVKRKGFLIAGVSEDSPPFSFREDTSDNLVGYDIDFAGILAKKLGVKLKLKPVTEADRLSDLIDGKIDIITGLTQTESRGTVMAFSKSYLVSGQKILSRLGAIKKPEDLENKMVGAVVGTFSESCAREQCKVSNVVSVDSYLDGIEALKNGDLDAFTADETILIDLLAGLPSGEYEISDFNILTQEYSLGIRRGEKDFLTFVNNAIDDMNKNGEMKEVRNRWFTPMHEPPPPAYGAIVRKAASRPRFLGIIVNGVLQPQTPVSIYSMNGHSLGKGTISSVIGDEFYVDVDESIYDSVRSGYLVAMSMTPAMAMEVLTKRKNVLNSVKTEAEKESEAIRAAIDKEGLEKQQRAREMDTLREQNRISMQRDRARYFNYYGNYGRHRRLRR